MGNERTALAWQRTALAIACGSVLLARITFDRIGTFALVSVVVSAPLSVWVLVESRYRYAHDAEIRRRPRSRGGRAPTALAVAVIVLSLTELAALASD